MNSTPMTPRMTKSKKDARAAYNKHAAEAAARLAQLQKILAGHKALSDKYAWNGVDGSHGPHWGHVGDVERIAARLGEIIGSVAEVA